MDKEHIISEIRRTAEENGGKPLGIGVFKKETGINVCDWQGKYWTKWGAALTEAGYDPNKMQSAYADDFLIKNLLN